MTKKGNLEWYKYVYDEYYDCVICPKYQILKYTTTNKYGYREYKSAPEICGNCPSRARCTASKNCQKTVAIHIWKDYIEQAEDVRHSPIGKETYEKRGKTIERVFADGKEKYAMRYTPYRGLSHVSNWVKLKYAAMNLKKLAMWRWKDELSTLPPCLSRVLYLLLSVFKMKNPIFVY
jgi:transcription elongation factor Elf1